MSTVREYFETLDYGPAPEGDEAAKRFLDQHAGRFGIPRLAAGVRTTENADAVHETATPRWNFY
jgi:hypothetical protein